MLKKLPLGLVFTVFGLAATYGQTIVSTSPENKNVVLEEFTGIHCVYCPDGHAISQAIQNANPDRVSLINIHTGGYAIPSGSEPDFRTPFGDAIAAQTGLQGYPSGTVNRHVFSGSNTILDRGQWTSRANQIIAMPSYVNLAATAVINAETNVMEIHVEAYYTGDSPESTNLLNVALVQNNTKGPQTGGQQGSNYNHMHRLIDMITGQWGEEITQTTSGTFVERDYSYPILTQNNNVPVEIGDLEVIVYMSETHQEIESGNRTTPIVNLTNSNDANVRYVEDFGNGCSGEEFSFVPKVNIQNVGTDPITSLNISYSINGESETYPWSGNIPSLKSLTIALPAVSTTLSDLNTFEVSVPSDDYNDNNTLTVPFSVPNTTGTLNLKIQTDDHGNEVRVKIKGSDGSTVFRGGPYASNSTIRERIYIDADCYTFELLDTGGNGGNIVTLKDSDDVEIFHTDGAYATQINSKFHSDGVLGVSNVDLQNISIYPNPASTVLNISNAENSNVEVYNILGQLLLSKTNIALKETLNVASFETGTYLIKITKDNQTTTKKFVVSK